MFRRPALKGRLAKLQTVQGSIYPIVPSFVSFSCLTKIRMNTSVYQCCIPERIFLLALTTFPSRITLTSGLICKVFSFLMSVLTASDVRESLDPLEIKHSQESGPYAAITCIG